MIAMLLVATMGNGGQTSMQREWMMVAQLQWAAAATVQWTAGWQQSTMAAALKGDITTSQGKQECGATRGNVSTSHRIERRWCNKG
jgi:hypothetical protein